MIRVAIKDMRENNTKFTGSLNCPDCNGIVWFFTLGEAPSGCPYCRHQFVKLFGLMNGFMLAKTRYYKYGDE